MKPRYSKERQLALSSSLLAGHLKKHKYGYILLGTVVVFNLGIFRDLLADWYSDSNYSHGFLIIPVSVYLFLRRRKELVFPSKNCGMGLVILALGCFGLVFGTAASEFFTTRVSFIAVITGISLYYLGVINFKKVWFAFVFLFFMVPIPAVIYYSATLPMQLFSSGVTDLLLRASGAQTALEGNIIYFPGYALEVAEACSGLRSLVTLMALSALYAYLTLPGRARPIILFAASIPIAIITNIVRLYITGIGAYAVSAELAEGFLHEVSGLLVFVTALILIFILGALLRWPKRAS